MREISILARQNGRDYSLEAYGLLGKEIKLKFAKNGDASYLKVLGPTCRTILKHKVEVTRNGKLEIERLNLHSLKNVSISILGSIGVPVTEVYRRNLRLYKPYHIELKELLGSNEVENKANLS